MRLAALYIPGNMLPHVFGDDHEDLTINFGGKYIYKVKNDKVVEKKLNNKFIPELWDSITLLSAIVGANGTGKSSLLNCFRGNSFCLSVYENEINDEYEITAIESAYQDFFYYTPHFEMISEGSENNNFRDISKFPLMVDDVEYERNDLTTLLELHASENLKRWIKFSNLEFLKEDKIDLPIFDKIKIKINHIPIRESETSYKFRDFFRRFKEIESEQRPIDEQKKLDEAGLKTSEEVRRSNVNNQLRLSYEIISRVIDKTQNILEATDNKFLIEGYINSDWDTDSLEFTKHAKSLKRSFYWFLENAYVQLSSKSEKKYLPKKEISALLEALLKHIPENDEIKNWTEMNVSQEAALEILETYEQFLLAFKDDFAFDRKILLTFSPYRRLSSGERGMYNLFSSFLDLKYRYENSIANDYFKFGKKDTLANDLAILIDEGDLGFHPHWKKKYVHFLITILPKIFSTQSLQIIIATHDPLTLSDIPNNNIVYMTKRLGEYSEILDKFKNPKQSFGANITDLLADSFFVENGLIGDFAKGKIEEVINWLNYKILTDEIVAIKYKLLNGIEDESTKLLKSKTEEAKLLHDSRLELTSEYCFSLINIVDEPLLKYKLEEMYYLAFPEKLQENNTKEQIKAFARKLGRDDIAGKI